ncbi:MAG: ABC transporter permease [Firmicutes bacterium]|nr:ABC transporter permease [Bacillota bacterium]
MKQFIAKRTVINIFVLFFVALVIYALMRALPTDYVERIARQKASLPGAKSYQEWLAQLGDAYGYNDNVFVGFFKWLGNVFQGNFGDSWQYNQPVIDKFKDVIWYSVVLGAITFVLEIAIAVPLGILSARKQYSKTDYAITVCALLGISLPTFYIATLLKYVFSVKLGWFDLYGIVGRDYEFLSGFGKFMDMTKHMILPILTLTLVSVGSLMRYTRTNMLEVLNSDYIRTARAKGVPENRVINHHAFRNTLIPLVTIVGGSLPGLFSGAMITEQLFQIPGIGYISYEAMVGGDIPFTMFYMTFMALLVLVGTLISDILYAVVDPRVRVN